jgi:ABC-2 type transport system permease protein
VLGKALGGSVRALIQTGVVLVLALLLHVRLQWEPLGLLGVVLLIVLGAAVFSSFSLIIACLVKTRERFMGIGQLLTMPLFFASNAIYPMTLMPPWLQVVAHLNPLTYQIDGLRLLLLPSGEALPPLGLATDFAVLIVALIVLATLSARLYPHLVR